MEEKSGGRHEREVLEEWSPERSVLLVEAYRDRPELWDMTHPRYRMHTIKQKLWEEIATMCESSVNIVRRKINSVAAYYRKESKRMRSGGSSRPTTWFLYEHMSFMPNYVDKPLSTYDKKLPTSRCVTKTKPRPRPPVREVSPSPSPSPSRSPSPQPSSPDMEAEYLEYEQGSDEGHESGDEIKMEPELVIQPRMRPRVARPTRLHHRPARVTRPPARPPARPHRPVRVPNTRTKDECDSFGEYIADSLRKHDGRTQSMIKQAINNILFEQEMNKYSGAGRYAVVLADDDGDNPLLLAGHEE